MDRIPEDGPWVISNDYKELRIALADGKCVTDRDGLPHRLNEYMSIQFYKKEWINVQGMDFGPNSKVVDDPSFVPQGACFGDRDCGNEAYKPESLTYDEALKAEKPVQIHWPECVIEYYPYKRNFQNKWAPVQLILFYLAERKGYKMEIVE